jgi:hypothetical protein
MNSTPAKRPVAAPAAAVVGVIAAVLVIAVGVVGIRETLVSTGSLAGGSWLEWLFGKAEVLKPADWMVPAGVAAVVLGLWTLAAGLKPRRGTHLAVGADTGVWIRRRDAARLAANSARTIDSVTTAAAKAKRRALRVTATATGDTARVHDDLTTAIAQRLHAVTPTPRVRTRVTVEEN